MLHQSIALIGLNDHFLILVVLVLLLFGGQKIPQLMRSLGRSMGEFQRGIEEGRVEMAKATAKTKELQALPIQQEESIQANEVSSHHA